MNFKRRYEVLVQKRWQELVIATDAEHAVVLTQQRLINSYYWVEKTRSHYPYFDITCEFVYVKVCSTNETVKVKLNYNEQTKTWRPESIWE